MKINIWKDSVFSKIIANSIWVILSALIGLAKKIDSIDDFINIEVKMYVIIITIIVIFILIAILQIFTKTKRISYSERYELFNLGDNVCMKNCMNKRYTVVNKKHNFIYAVDKENKTFEFSPEVLMSKNEINEYYEKISEARKRRGSLIY